MQMEQTMNKLIDNEHAIARSVAAGGKTLSEQRPGC